MSKINVLDKGYVRLVDILGSDVTVVNAARVSYDKAVDKMGPKDERLLSFLAEKGHTSPFRHAVLQFEVYAPLMIARQWWKYVAGSDHAMDAWNESSRRYITESCEFTIPKADEWRSAPENSKQGSGEPINDTDGLYWTEELMNHVDKGVELYGLAMTRGIAPEQARLFLPAYGMMVRWVWTGSLQSVAHLINQRTAPDAQFEFQEYAQAVEQLASEKFPVSIREMVGGEQ